MASVTLRPAMALWLAALALAACGSLSEKGKGLNSFNTKSFWCSGNCGGDKGDGVDDADSQSESSHSSDSSAASGGDSGGN